MSQDVLVVKFKDRWTTLSLKSLQSRYVKPTLKKVSKYENKFAKLQKKVIFWIRHKIEAKFEPTFNPEHWLHERINPGGWVQLPKPAKNGLLHLFIEDNEHWTVSQIMLCWRHGFHCLNSRLLSPCCVVAGMGIKYVGSVIWETPLKRTFKFCGNTLLWRWRRRSLRWRRRRRRRRRNPTGLSRCQSTLTFENYSEPN